MSDEHNAEIPSSFKIIAGVAIVWNLLGLMAYFMDVMMSPEVLAAMSDAERAMYENRPSWVISAYAIAVHAGTIGSIGLFLKKGWSVPLLMLSLAGIIVQQIYIYFMSGALEASGIAGLILPLLVLVIGIYLVHYSRTAKAKGWLS